MTNESPPTTPPAGVRLEQLMEMLLRGDQSTHAETYRAIGPQGVQLVELWALFGVRVQAARIAELLEEREQRNDRIEALLERIAIAVEAPSAPAPAAAPASRSKPRARAGKAGGSDEGAS